MKTSAGGKGLILRTVCLIAVTVVLMMIAAIAPCGFMAANTGYAWYIESSGIGGGGESPGKLEWNDSQDELVLKEASPLSSMPCTGISGTLQIVLCITLGISILFLCIILRAIIKERHSCDEEER